MELSAEQERCKAAFLSYYKSKNRKPYFYIEGPAGSGKTSIVMESVSSLDGLVLYAAYTGKAALVMKQRGCPDPRTLHSILYKPNGLAGRRLEIEKLQDQLSKIDAESDQAKTLKRSLDRELSAVRPMFMLNTDSILQDASLLVIDECSMVDRTLFEDALSFNVPILVQGDSFQLPPVRAQSYFADRRPDFMLTEIHRQAKESPVLQLATQIREGKRLVVGQYGTSRVLRSIDEFDAMEHDQIIVGRNKTRKGTNSKVRRLKGIESVFPVTGERVICTQNNHKLGLLNGAQYIVTSCREASPTKLLMGIQGEGIDQQVVCHKDYFVGTEPGPWSKSDAECFDFAYSITCHKSQGSAWRSVFVLDESRDFGKDANRWLYTACTRSSERVTIKI